MDPSEVESSTPADNTEGAPTLVRAAPPPAVGMGGGLGQKMGDFLLLRELGRGGFARVYLAHQVSLERRVALKISKHPSRGEGQTLSKLEHEHIVKVYAEFSDAESGQHGLVLQYIPGTSLAEVLHQIHKEGRRPQHGAEILEAIDRLARDDVDFDPAALEDREVLAASDYVTSVCRLGAKLAEALAFAHHRGVLHCDIKPGNILLNRYGRPLLVDFNVAAPIRGEGEKQMGGTVLYMAPEQLAAFARLPEGDVSKVDQRADLYALGLVLLEMLMGRLPQKHSTSKYHTAVEVLVWKRQQPEDWLPAETSLPTIVWRVIRRCLDPDPAKRYQSGTDLAHALNQAANMLEARAALPPESRMARLARLRPLTSLIVLALLPHLLGSFVNIAYNGSHITLSPEQKAVFGKLVPVYNAVVYPLCGLLGWLAIKPLIGMFDRAKLATMPTAELDRLRHRALSLGNYAIVLALLGWLPGGIAFPTIIHLFTGSLGWEFYAHYIISFTLSGLIAIVYSYLAAEYVVLRGMYPRLIHAEEEPAQVRRELDDCVAWVGFFQLLAALVPLSGAVLLLVLAVGELSLVFRLLVVSLIIAGMVGLGLAVYLARSLREVVTILKGASAPTPAPGRTGPVSYG